MSPVAVGERSSLRASGEDRSRGPRLEVQANQGEGHRRPPLTSRVRSLARAAKVDTDFVERVLARDVFPYAPLPVSKPSGAPRLLLSPSPDLMHVQRVLLKSLLRDVPLHPMAFAYRRRRSVVECGQVHARAHTVIRLDIADFYNNIRERQVYAALLESLDVDRLTAYQLALLTTVVLPEPSPTWINRGTGSRSEELSCRVLDRRVLVRASRLRRYMYVEQREGFLPQGAPTSGVLSNAVMRAPDAHLQHLATRLDLRYTRYSDDLHFSSRHLVKRADIDILIREVKARLEKDGFALNDAKTRVARPGSRRVVLGLLVDGAAPRLPVETHRRIEKHIRGARRFGLQAHVDHVGYGSAQDLVHHVEGLLAWAAYVEPVKGGAYLGRWREVLGSAAGMDEWGDPLAEQPRSSVEEAKASINSLLEQGQQYRSTAEYANLLSFIGRFRRYAPFNAMLVHMQRPGARYVLTAARWRSQFGRVIKPGAQNLIMLQPGGPYMIVYDVGDTEPLRGAPALPRDVLDPVAATADLEDRHLERLWARTVDNAVRLGIRIILVDHAKASCGQASRTQARDTVIERPGPRGQGVESFPLRFEVLVNRNLALVDRYVTLVHELAHLRCGHLGGHLDHGWPDRRLGSQHRDEVEAESVAYMALLRLDSKAAMDDYLLGHVRDDATLPEDLRLDLVVEALSEVIAMGDRRLPR